jgi:hypothetical protein
MLFDKALSMVDNTRCILRSKSPYVLQDLRFWIILWCKLCSRLYWNTSIGGNRYNYLTCVGVRHIGKEKIIVKECLTFQMQTFSQNLIS